MTLFQMICVWSLRAALAWGAFELGADAWQEASDDFARWTSANAYQREANELGVRMEHAQAAARGAQGELAQLNAPAWPLAQHATADEVAASARTIFRDRLIALGAEAPNVDARALPISDGLWTLEINARWREPSDRAGAVVFALARAEPELRVRSMRLQRTQDRETIASDSAFSLLLRAEAGP